MAESDTQQSQEAPQGEFTIQKVYIKDVSFETPHSPLVFSEKWAPDTKLQLRSAATKQGEDLHEVILTLVVTAQLGEKTAYLVEVQQAGLFNIKGFEGEQLAGMLGSYCPSVLFPFAREVVADLVAKGGFPQLLLAPVNFDALFAHFRAQKGQGDTTH